MPNDVSQISSSRSKHGQGAKTPDYNSGKAAVGTGPYRFVEYTPGNRIVMQRNDQYWGDKPTWQRVDLPRASSPIPRASPRCSPATSTSSTRCRRPTWSA